MIETRVEIVNKLGLHARAAAKLVACTSAFASPIEAGRDGNRVAAKWIMSVMVLAAGKGDRVDLEVAEHVREQKLKAETLLPREIFWSLAGSEQQSNQIRRFNEATRLII